MRTLDRLLLRCRLIFQRHRIEQDLDDEMRFHLEQQREEYVAAGMSPDEARRAAARVVGSVAHVKDDCRDSLGTRLLDSVRQDLSYAGRTLLNAPGFAATAVITMGLGIGASVAFFSVMYSILLKPLPYRAPDRLVLLRADVAVSGTARLLPLTLTWEEFDPWRKAHTFTDPALYTRGTAALDTDHGAVVIDDAIVSDEFFSTLGGTFLAGRPLTLENGATASVVLSARLAGRLFGGASDAIGRSVTLTGRPYTVVGVAASDLQFPEAATDAWLSARYVRTFDARPFGFQLIARAAPQAPIASMNAEVEAIARAQGRNGRIHGTVTALADDVVAPVAPAVRLLFVSVTLVLAVACLNLVNLFLARNASRVREYAIRAALGASRGRILRQSVMESTAIAAVGAAIGTAAAAAGVAIIARSTQVAIPRLDAVRIDGAALLFATTIMAIVALVVGIGGALPALGLQPNAVLLAKLSAVRAHGRVRQTLCAAEMATAFMLLVSALLLSRSVIQLTRADTGVSPDHVAIASLNVGYGQRPNETETVQRIQRIVERVELLPGVHAAGVGTAIPPATSRLRITLRREGDVVDYAAAAVPVSPGYFAALGLRLMQGRLFTSADDAAGPAVMIMTESTARRFFGDARAVGQTLSLPQVSLTLQRKPAIPVTLVGIVADVKYAGLAASAEDVIYRPFAQSPWTAPFLVTKTSGDPAAFLPILRRTMVDTDAGVVISGEGTLAAELSRATARPRLQAALMAFFAIMTVGLASVGLYGVVSFEVVQRTTEIGVRMALGAAPRRILAMALSDGLRAGIVGVMLGAGGSLATAKIIETFLYGIAPTDRVSFVAAAILLLGVAAAASYLPARQAIRIDPLKAIRQQ